MSSHISRSGGLTLLLASTWCSSIGIVLLISCRLPECSSFSLLSSTSAGIKSMGPSVRPALSPPKNRRWSNAPLNAEAVSSSSSQQQDSKEEEFTYEEFDDSQLDFTMGYLNKHHDDALRELAVAFTEQGDILARRNRLSGGSYLIFGAEVTSIDTSSAQRMTLDVTVKDRDRKETRVERTSFSLDANPVTKKFDDLPLVDPITFSSNKIDIFVRKFNRLLLIVNYPDVTGKMIQLAFQLGGSGLGKIRENLYLNAVPHNRYVRRYFYDMANRAVLDAVIQCSEHKVSNRMKLTLLIPELNPSMDSYRIGTLLELARSIAIHLAEQNLRVRVCVQGSMGVGIFTGLPKSLGGVMRLLQMMDWESEDGEENDGMVGEYVRFGHIGAEHVVNAHVDSDGNKVEQDDVFILLSPQSMVGLETSIIAPLESMVEAAGDRPIILINPDLTDKVSSQGQQSVRGRQQRIDFANSFESIYHFQCLYMSGTSYFPILGALGKMEVNEPWIAYLRRDLMNEEGEVYLPTLATETRPRSEMIKASFGT